MSQLLLGLEISIVFSVNKRAWTFLKKLQNLVLEVMCITSVHISLVRMQPYVPPHNGQGTIKSLKNEFASKEKKES